ncbi:MAG: GntR family transcriptional regulator, partial [Pseudomonadota bacterium]
MHKIKDLIFSGELTADSNHLETELAERLGMSRTPIREATIMLEAHGLLEVQPRKGVRIKAVSLQDMADIYDILTELESLSARRAAERKPGKDEMKVLLAAIDEMDTALADENREQWAEADEKFHTELVRLGGNRHIQDMVK